jgi:hypothetical protein
MGLKLLSLSCWAATGLLVAGQASAQAPAAAPTPAAPPPAAAAPVTAAPVTAAPVVAAPVPAAPTVPAPTASPAPANSATGLAPAAAPVTSTSVTPVPTTEPGVLAPPAEAPPAAGTDVISPPTTEVVGLDAAPADGGSLPAADSAAGWGDLSTLESEGAETPVFQGKIYGFIDSYYEKVARTPESVDEQGNTVYVENPGEFDVLNFNVMIQGAIYDKYRFFINLASPGAGSTVDDEVVSVRNAWVEAPIVPGYLNVRAGKTYRRFGLYNEILDAVPTFIGIETPEIFDKDHLMVTRTTNLMLHGKADLGPGTLNYSVSTGNDERGSGAFPVGADVNFDALWGIKVGSSFYTSGGNAEPSRAVGDGSPRGGVVNWMEKDDFILFGGYAQLQKAGFILQLEAWQANHDAIRDAASVAQLSQGWLNPTQLRRFYVGGDPDAGVLTDADYKIRTGYLRAGYEIPVGDLSSITPYIQGDYYSNPETVKEKDYGGDEEAGLADDGTFLKYTAGVVVRPVSQVALKVDGSAHQLEYNNKTDYYPEIRVSFSYLWEVAQ